MNIALKDFEHIRQIYRQTPYVLVQKAGLSALILLLLVYMAVRFQAAGGLRVVLIIAMVGILGHILREVILWRLNRYVITNQRILHYAQRGLFDQTVTETPHERVLNVSYNTQGAFSTVLGYGNVVVQVVGLMEPIILKNISMPMEIKDYLWDMHTRVVSDQKGKVYAETDATHVQERVGYTKHNKTE
jgi:hypothetical protein